MSQVLLDSFESILAPANLLNAWERVRDNRGCRGSDGETIRGFAQGGFARLQSLVDDIRSGDYAPYPLLRFPVPKRNSSSVRYLSVPTVRDRVAQAAAYLALKDAFEHEFEEVSHAYREGRGVHTALENIRRLRKQGFRYAVDADVAAFFDNVPHERLLAKIDKLFAGDKRLVDLFEKWIRVEVYDGQTIRALDKGIPQGSVVSPMLANLFLDELDETLMHFDRKLVRYADDFLVLSRSPEEAAQNLELTEMVLEEMQLKLNPKKTEIVDFDRGFKFLGAIFLLDDFYQPLPKRQKPPPPVELPPPLTLKRYFELRWRSRTG
ncbi:MAG TPA: reverse transcriptase domain-containing protein [bacterium]|nr:reverse transcriptase domain-containing protein [bacterium]HOX84347.1 reverse transcriptase domain-containing protein [bacterium]HPG46056.1 reverse transcriptase domain-containing protein [bacterium]HPM97878.1 reverse transcriptase domain-containing protein [bacterium]